ncbi:MAG TPA: YdcH family protein [Rhodocyclaceae bacterium]|nr:YdcH family protein [Rhodocyclaceae bacterium]
MTDSANDEPRNLVAQLHELRLEHRDLDDALARLESAPPPYDELLLRRMKKRKLQIKDRIAVIERMLEPDDLA